MQAGERVRFAPFEVSLVRAMSFAGKPRRPFVLRPGAGGEELGLLRRSIDEALTGSGLPYRGRGSFTPHMTLRYDRQAASDVELLTPITWVVRDFVLVHSMYGKTRHVHCARWPLLPH